MRSSQVMSIDHLRSHPPKNANPRKSFGLPYQLYTKGNRVMLKECGKHKSKPGVHARKRSRAHARTRKRTDARALDCAQPANTSADTQREG